MKLTGFLAAAIAISTAGCATVTSGTVQMVTISSSPSGADCDVVRDGHLMKRLVTPDSVTVAKSHSALTITCRKPGYTPVIGSDPSDLNGWIVGNVTLGPLLPIGVLVDLATGADETYGRNVLVTMRPAYYGQAAMAGQVIPDYPPPAYPASP